MSTTAKPELASERDIGTELRPSNRKLGGGMLLPEEAMLLVIGADMGGESLDADGRWDCWRLKVILTGDCVC